MNFNNLSKIYAQVYYQELAPLSSQNIIFSLSAPLYNIWHELIFDNIDVLSLQGVAVTRTLGAAGHLNWRYTPTNVSVSDVLTVHNCFHGHRLLSDLLRAYSGDLALVNVDALYSKFLDQILCDVPLLQKRLFCRSHALKDDALRTELQKELER